MGLSETAGGGGGGGGGGAACGASFAAIARSTITDATGSGVAVGLGGA
jgi:hypothetical protein